MKFKLIKSFLTATAIISTSTSPVLALPTSDNNTSGTHYNLNLIGVSNPKTADMVTNDGHRIFVPLTGQVKINLTAGDFNVLDANGTDGSAAFSLPHPDPENDGITVYSVYARALGKPGGTSALTACASDEMGEIWCSSQQLVLRREKGKSIFDNVSKELLYIYVDLDGDGVTDRYPLFDEALQGYFWDYDSNGMKVVQLRFYETPTNVNP